MPYSKPQECGVCKRVFLTPQHLISHFDTFHSNRHISTFSSPAVAAPTTLRYYSNLNRNPNPAFQARTHLDYYRRGYFDDQGKFHKGLRPTPAITPSRKYKYLLPKMPKLMDLFPATSSEGICTLPLLCQLEQRRVEDTVTETCGANSSSIDLSLRL